MIRLTRLFRRAADTVGGMSTDPTTRQLRDEGWRPRRGTHYACRCRPGHLCGMHAAIRTTELHHPETVPPRIGPTFVEPWTCPECGRSYWSPREWEPELWRAVAELARRIHERRHTQERIDAADAGRPPEAMA